MPEAERAIAVIRDFSTDTIAGFALAGGGTNFSIAGSDSGDSDLFQAGAFIRHTPEPARKGAHVADEGFGDVGGQRDVLWHDLKLRRQAANHESNGPPRRYSTNKL
jgi:hypothetical protein